MTLNDLLPNILTLCGQYGRSGESRSPSVEDYKARIPYIADMGQRELLDNVEKTYEYTKTASEGTGEYVAVEMPADFFGPSYVIDAGDNGRYDAFADIKFEGDKLYVKDSYRGTLRIRYRPCPAALIDLSGVLSVDDNTAKTALVYYIAAMLLIEENAQKADYYQQKYEEQRELLKRRPAAFRPIVDVYDTSCRV